MSFAHKVVFLVMQKQGYFVTEQKGRIFSHFIVLW